MHTQLPGLLSLYLVQESLAMLSWGQVFLIPCSLVERGKAGEEQKRFNPHMSVTSPVSFLLDAQG